MTEMQLLDCCSVLLLFQVDLMCLFVSGLETIVNEAQNTKLQLALLDKLQDLHGYNANVNSGAILFVYLIENI